MIEGEDKRTRYSLGEAFKKHSFVIPDQRDYHWQDEDVSKFLGKILLEYQEVPEDEFFMGVVTAFKNQNQTHEILSGQHQMATYFLILCAFKNLSGTEDLIDQNSGGLIEMRYPGTQDLCAFASQAYGCEILKDQLRSRVGSLRDSVKNLCNAYGLIIERLKEEFDSKEKLSCFKKYFKDSIFFILEETDFYRDIYRL